ncbi:MAG: hypothetical protein N3A65_08780 [candidate division WOR-3 bacterium]|nr:hypothetical protein [candidate division WOR-3 bacterium]
MNDDYEIKEKNDIVFRIEGKIRYMVYTNFGGIIAGGILLFLLLRIRGSYTTVLFIIGLAILVLYMVIDFLIWEKKGIRVIEIDKNGISLYRGKEKKLTRVEKNQITDIDFFSKLGRRVINILTGGRKFKPFPGVTIFQGPRIRITDDAFNDSEFSIFVERLKSFYGNPEHFVSKMNKGT